MASSMAAASSLPLLPWLRRRDAVAGVVRDRDMVEDLAGVS